MQVGLVRFVCCCIATFTLSKPCSAVHTFCVILLYHCPYMLPVGLHNTTAITCLQEPFIWYKVYFVAAVQTMRHSAQVTRHLFR